MKEAISAIGPAVPASLKSRIQLVTTCTFTTREIVIFSNAFQVFAGYIAGNQDIKPEAHLTALFLDKDDFSLALEGQSDFGLSLSIVIYPLHRWRAVNIGNQCMYACIFEELCHYFFSISDEIAVKYKVAEIMRIIFPDFEVDSFYNLHK